MVERLEEEKGVPVTSVLLWPGTLGKYHLAGEHKA